MNMRWIRFLSALLLVSALLLFLSGCWDNRELDTLFIVTGVALDKAENLDELDLALQIGKPKAGEPGSGTSGAQEDASMVLQTTAKTVTEGLMEINQNSRRTALLQHNQLLIFGSELAEQGVKDRIDLFLRDQETRMEVLVLVADGRGVDIISANPVQDNISGMYLSQVMQDLSKISPYYKIRVLDFVSTLRDESSSPVAPIVSLEGEEDKEELKIRGLALFRRDQMVGRLNTEETMGYLWARGKVKRHWLASQCERGKAAFQIAKLDSKQDISLRPDGGVRVKLSIDATLTVGELHGYEGMTTTELIPYLIERAQKRICEQIENTFKITQAYNADIYAFGESVHRKYPKEWKSMKNRWGELYPDIELEVQAKVHLPAMGQILKSMKMGESNP